MFQSQIEEIKIKLLKYFIKMKKRQTKIDNNSIAKILKNYQN